MELACVCLRLQLCGLREIRQRARLASLICWYSGYNLLTWRLAGLMASCNDSFRGDGAQEQKHITVERI